MADYNCAGHSSIEETKVCLAELEGKRKTISALALVIENYLAYDLDNEIVFHRESIEGKHHSEEDLVNISDEINKLELIKENIDKMLESSPMTEEQKEIAKQINNSPIDERLKWLHEKRNELQKILESRNII